MFHFVKDTEIGWKEEKPNDFSTQVLPTQVNNYPYLYLQYSYRVVVDRSHWEEKICGRFASER